MAEGGAEGCGNAVRKRCPRVLTERRGRGRVMSPGEGKAGAAWRSWWRVRGALGTCHPGDSRASAGPAPCTSDASCEVAGAGYPFCRWEE